MEGSTVLSLVTEAFATAEELVSTASTGMVLIAAGLCGVGLVIGLLKRN